MSASVIYIDPTIKLSYSSFYIQGFYEVFGFRNVRFSAEHFLGLDRRRDAWSYDAYMPIVLESDGKRYKIIIDFGDDIPIRENAYNWCDIYAKINYFPEKTGEFDKVVPIPPGFGIRIWNWKQILINCILNLFQLKFKPQISLFHYFRDYLSQLKMMRLERFDDQAVEEQRGDYVFFVSSLWPHQNCLEGTNLLRKSFMDSCRKAGADFEGGFLLLEESHPQKEEFAEFVFKKRYPLSIFVEKTKKSALVFNTPAVHNCHGWKLGQYLAMGKAIISTPLQNRLPQELRHGEDIHIVSGPEELRKAVHLLLIDQEYRKSLEKGARNYFDQNASPVSVIESIISKLPIEISNGEN